MRVGKWIPWCGRYRALKLEPVLPEGEQASIPVLESLPDPF